MNTEIDIQEISIDLINPAPYNPRKKLKPGDPQHEALAAGLEEFGLVEALIWNKRSGNLVGGHQRFEMLREDGKETAPCSVEFSALCPSFKSGWQVIACGH